MSFSLVVLSNSNCSSTVGDLNKAVPCPDGSEGLPNKLNSGTKVSVTFSLSICLLTSPGIVKILSGITSTFLTSIFFCIFSSPSKTLISSLALAIACASNVGPFPLLASSLASAAGTTNCFPFLSITPIRSPLNAP